MKKLFQHGFTLIEMMIVVVICGILLVVVVGATRGCSGGGSSSAEGEARSFLARLYPGKTFGVICQSWDSNGDGYVSCMAVSPEVDNGHPVSLDCASTFSFNDTCRMTRMIGQGMSR